MDTFHKTCHIVGIETDPQHHVLGANDTPQHLVPLAHAAIDGKVGVQALHRRYPRRQVTDKGVAHAGDLIVAPAKEAAVVGRIIKLERCHPFDGIRVKGQVGRHRVGVFFPDRGSKAGTDHDLLVALLEDLKGPDVRIHIGCSRDPVEVIVLVDVGISWQTQFLAPAFDKAAPEKVADRHAVSLLVPERLVHPF